MVKHCKKCGSELKEESDFCEECGARIDESYGKDIFKSYNIDMMDGEYVIRKSQIHSGCLALPIVVIGIGIFFGLTRLFMSMRLGYFDPAEILLGFLNILTFIGFLWLLIRYIGYVTNDLILTNKRVFGKCGLISTTQMQSPLNKIDSVSYSNGLIGKLIGYGTVKIATASTTFKFRFIRDGQTLYNDIFNQLEVSDDERRSSDAKAIVDAMAEKLS